MESSEDPNLYFITSSSLALEENEKLRLFFFTMAEREFHVVIVLYFVKDLIRIMGRLVFT